MSYRIMLYTTEGARVFVPDVDAVVLLPRPDKAMHLAGPSLGKATLYLNPAAGAAVRVEALAPVAPVGAVPVPLRKPVADEVIAAVEEWARGGPATG